MTFAAGRLILLCCYCWQGNHFGKKEKAMTAAAAISSTLTSKTHMALRLSFAVLVATTLLMARTGDAIDLMKLLDQKQQRNIKRAGKFPKFFFLFRGHTPKRISAVRLFSITSRKGFQFPLDTRPSDPLKIRPASSYPSFDVCDVSVIYIYFLLWTFIS